MGPAFKPGEKMGVLVVAPSRGVPGSSWMGDTTCWSGRPWCELESSASDCCRGSAMEKWQTNCARVWWRGVVDGGVKMGTQQPPRNHSIWAQCACNSVQCFADKQILVDLGVARMWGAVAKLGGEMQGRGSRVAIVGAPVVAGAADRAETRLEQGGGGRWRVSLAWQPREEGRRCWV
jgi:hypothetical protein